MISISQNSGGSNCDNCLEKPALYSIRGDEAEWTGPRNLCQSCMLGQLGQNEKLRHVLLLQGGILASIGVGS
jgi:hypothetical protein